MTQSGYGILSKMSSLESKLIRRKKKENKKNPTVKYDPYTGRTKAKTGNRNCDSDQMSDLGGKYFKVAIINIFTVKESLLKRNKRDFPGGTVVRNPPANAGDTGLIPGPERSHMPRSS